MNSHKTALEKKLAEAQKKQDDADAKAKLIAEQRAVLEKDKKPEAAPVIGNTLFNEKWTVGLIEWWNIELKDRTPEWAAEVSGISAKDIITVAREFATTKPAVALFERGASAHTNGVYNGMAIHALNALTGNMFAKGGLRGYPNTEIKWFPRPCMHCENPSCVAVCPVRATYKSEDGQVLVDWERCIGCKYCMIACPYGVRFYTEEKAAYGGPNVKEVFPGTDAHSWNPPWKMPQEDWSHGVGVQPHDVVSKCTFCYHRVSKAPKGTADLDPQSPDTREYTPACVVTCPTGARFFGDLANPDSEVNKQIAYKNGVRLLDHLGNKPQVYYLTGEGGSVPATRSLKKI